MTDKAKDLEQKLNELEKIIDSLAKDKLNLGENIKGLERGTKLYQECKAILAQAEKKVKKLTDSLREEDFS